MASIKFMAKGLSAEGHDCAVEVELWRSANQTGTDHPQSIANGLGKVPAYTRVVLVGLPASYVGGEIIEGMHDANDLYVQAPTGWIYYVEAYA